MPEQPAGAATKITRQPAEPRLRLVIAVLSAGALAACGSNPSSGVPAPAGAETETEMKVRLLQESILAGPKNALPDWAIGPFRTLEVGGKPATFRMDVKWKDPAGATGWEANAFWNPALLEENGRLYLFYRTGPRLEGLDSRIALAWSDDGGGTWTDYENNPILYPTESWERSSVEDPRVYRHNGRYYLFYMAAEHRPGGGVYANIAMASSDDLFTWTKHGRVMSHEVSLGWAKSPVIPRSPTGDAVRIGGEFLMFVSERPFASKRDVEEQMVGRSTDLLNWQFEQRPFLEPDGKEIESIFEVATLTTDFPGSDDMVGDVFYRNARGEWSCGEVLYNKRNPTQALDFTPYGVCSWGGKIFSRGQWLYAQGWLRRDAIQLYAAPPRQRDRRARK
jgi:hypothetical protein